MSKRDDFINMSDTWNAKTYSQFLNLRTRPARDLLAAIPDSFQPNTVYDLGCGPGNSTILLKQRWPHAKTIGLDSSPNMLQEAKSAYPELDFIEGDIASFIPSQRVDCLFANASLQWLDQHEILIPKLLEWLNPGGVLAIQMPNNFHSPMHQVSIQILHSQENWRHLLSNLRYGFLNEPVYKIPWYYELLTKSGVNQLLLWETQYFQEMAGYHEILEWVKGTNLRLVMANMNGENQQKFTKIYVDAISKQYPLQSNKKILLPFTRIFLIGFKPDSN